MPSHIKILIVLTNYLKIFVFFCLC